MPSTLSDIIVETKNITPEIDTELTTLQIQQTIKRAAVRFSQDHPKTRAELISGNGTKYYDLVSLLTNFDEDFSNVERVEYPAYAVSENYEPTYLENNEWVDDYELYDAGTETRYLLLDGYNPSASDSIRIFYTMLREWSASSVTEAVAQVAHGFSLNDTVYLDAIGVWVAGDVETLATHIVTAVADADNFTVAVLQYDVNTNQFYALATLSASFACYAISEFYSRTSQPTISADSVDHNPRAIEFAKRGRELMAQYETMLGETPGVELPAGAFINFKTYPSGTGRRWLTHNERRWTS